jgi:site-specific DNA-methyltransferase (adenine-specific)/adenine-specific DNA-methyltransferase
MSNDQTNVEQFEFEPIKGYPMLNWKGKRPFRSTQYFPAQLKEVYGQEDESGWINKIFWGDNLQVMSHLLKEFRGKIDLIYIDPPFDSKADYKKIISLKKQRITNDLLSFEEKQYSDIWSNDEYLQFIYERIILIKELLRDEGIIALHCDWHKGHYIRSILDEVFGPQNFVNDIIWQRTGAHNDADRFGIIHDYIFVYSKSTKHPFNPVHVPLSEAHVNSRFKLEEKDGRRFFAGPITAPGSGPTRIFEGREIAPPANRHWSYSQQKIDELIQENRIYYSSTGTPYLKQYMDEYVQQGRRVQSIWTDILPSKTGSEIVGYPTQKPEKLLERIIDAYSVEGALVFDCFMGSGTTQAVSSKSKRKFIGADINLGSVQITTKRLASLFSNFEVYNVNNYDVFRNPVEAKELLIESLEIQKLDSNTAYDGEKDGYKVKIMPVNRIATKADLDDLIANLPYKQFETRKEAEPNKSVEEIMLVCMGHEPSLAADLENDVLSNGYKIKVKVVDILRDKSDLTFKYDSEASIKVENGKLFVEAFYPRNLLQKLSQQKDDVTEWREMVESIMIDWNYDGAVMEPELIDIPTKNDFVNGEYEIPAGANNIKIKITDLLSESYEEVIAHG